MEILTAVLDALRMAFAMFWEILWVLILGFSLSAVVHAVVSKPELSRILGNDSPKTLSIATALSAASASMLLCRGRADAIDFSERRELRRMIQIDHQSGI